MIRKLILSISLLFFFSLGCASSGFRSPKVLTRGYPEYPLSAQLERAEGEVVLALFVNSDGYVDEIEYLNSSGRKDLDSAALHFAENLTFKPASLNGNPLSVWTKLALRFKLTEIQFDPNRWYFEVIDLQRKIAAESTPKERERLLKKLYTAYHGLLNHVAKNPNAELNDTILRIVGRNVQKRWGDYSRLQPLGFVVLDDFVERYPDDSVTSVVKERLMKELVDFRYDLKMLMDKSSSNAKKYGRLLQAVDRRLKTLGVVIPAET